MKRKKKGSSLAYVLLITASVMVVGTTCLTMLTMGLKTTIQENKRMQSLYGADAGIDWAQSLLMGTFQTATKYAEQQVTEIYKYDFDNSKMEELNQCFKQEFKNFIDNKEIKDESTNEFVQALQNKVYYITPDKKLTQKIEFSSTSSYEPIFKSIESSFEDDIYKIELTSTFDTAVSEMSNKREISVVFEIEVPDFRGQYLDENVDIYPVYNDKVMAIDGDLNISNSKITVNGGVFVVGNEVDEIEVPTYDKYKGGITLTQSELNFSDNIVTANTMNLISNSKLDGNSLYARNLYLGSTNATDYPNISWTVTENVVKLEEVILDNDLAIKATNSKVTIHKFYGINDKTYETLDVNAKTADINKTSKTSSSIIINQKEGSSLTIKDEAYIMGVAYIDTLDGGKYETGESIAVKGNYIAYTQPLVGTDFEEAQFSYYKPLYLVDQMSGESLSVLEKNDYFYEFVKQQTNATEQGDVVSLDRDNSVLSSGGVNLGTADVYAVGAIVYTDGENLIVEKVDIPPGDIVRNKQIEFANMVYNMGKEHNPPVSEDGLGLYQSGTQLKVADSIDFKLLKERCKQNSSLCKAADLFIDFSNQAINLNEELGNSFTGIILTDSDIMINSDFTLNGILMTTGTVTIKNTNTSQKSYVELNYNKNVVQTIISNNYELFDGVFKKETLIEKTDVNGFLEYDAKNYNPTNFIKTKNWKLIH